MAGTGARWQAPLRMATMISLGFLLASVFVSAERSLKDEASRSNDTEVSLSNYLHKVANFLWQSDVSGYQHVWPKENVSVCESPFFFLLQVLRI
uniref:Uncharacterized protein n=1 Tax=Nelumbo nucifera TaxID=4432 RepID=A0A822Y3R6_NELNU|nr:TPA_asm: hypothetical protein HUJ06_028380 [Nelumbo nucifera]